MLYRHVEILRKAGFDAYVVHHLPGFRATWFQSSAPVLYAQAGLALDAADWVVIPEDHSAALQGFKNVGCRKAIFCQGHYHLFDFFPLGDSWSDYGVSEILVSSVAIRDFIRTVFAIDPAYIPLSLDQTLFRPAAADRTVQIAFMPRKGAHHVRLIQGLLHYRASDLRYVPWIPIDKCSETEVASRLQQSAFFLSTGVREGFGLPPLEAMACGAIVMGFRAGGGSEYATRENGFWIADEDAFALADKLIEVLHTYRDEAAIAAREAMRTAGYATAVRYTRAAEAERLLAFWATRAPLARA